MAIDYHDYNDYRYYCRRGYICCYCIAVACTVALRIVIVANLSGLPPNVTHISEKFTTLLVRH